MSTTKSNERYEEGRIWIAEVCSLALDEPGGVQWVEDAADLEGAYGRLCVISAQSPAKEYSLINGIGGPRGLWVGGARSVGWWEEPRGWRCATAKFRAFTPHDVVLHLPGEVRTIPTEGSARVIEETEPVEVYGLPAVRKRYTRVEGLPAPEPGTIFIASLLVCQALPWRTDLACPDTGPGSVVRDGAGQIIGVRRLQVVHGGGVSLPIRNAADIRAARGRLKASYYPLLAVLDFVGPKALYEATDEALLQTVCHSEEREGDEGYLIIPSRIARRGGIVAAVKEVVCGG